MRWTIRLLTTALLVLSAVLASAPPAVAQQPCPADSVRIDTQTCVDKYETSLWKTTNTTLIRRIRAGTATLADLTAAGATQLGISNGDLAANGCPISGNGCTQVYAVSISGVAPARFVTWFQAAAAARNSVKRLLTNAEWQVAALGTPNPGASPGPQDCNTVGPSYDLTGARPNCVSDIGVFDMVGNVIEWIADWVPFSTDCPGWADGFSDDDMCMAGASTTFGGPGAVLRGGHFLDGTKAGVFMIHAGGAIPQRSSDLIGFRCGR